MTNLNNNQHSVVTSYTSDEFLNSNSFIQHLHTRIVTNITEHVIKTNGKAIVKLVNKKLMKEIKDKVVLEVTNKILQRLKENK